MRVHHSVFASVAALACCLTIACGSDDDSSGNSAGGGGTSDPIIFTDNTAGKACAINADCGNGECRKEFTGNQLFTQTKQAAPGGYCTFKCNLSADCGAGASCVGTPESLCLATCSSNSDCREGEGYHCVDSDGQPIAAGRSSGTCRVAPVTDHVTGQTVGNACASADDCSGGTCTTTGYPEGYCSGRCLKAADCGEQAVCALDAVGTLTAAGTCYRTCSGDPDCRTGYRCRGGDGSDPTKVCLPGGAPLPDGVVGNTCGADTDCGGADGSCVKQILTINGQLQLPGGYCSSACVDASDCGAGGSCLGLEALTEQLSPGCYKLCSGAEACRTGYECRTVGQSAEDQPTVCTPVLPIDQDAGVP